jgi:hypothetical protein
MCMRLQGGQYYGGQVVSLQKKELCMCKNCGRNGLASTYDVLC